MTKDRVRAVARVQVVIEVEAGVWGNECDLERTDCVEQVPYLVPRHQ